VDAAPDRDGARVGAEGLWNAWKRSSGVVALAVVLTLVAYWWFTMVVSGPTDWAFDFRQFWQGGNDVVNGVSPYPTVAQIDAAGDEFGPTRIQEIFRFPYPASAAVALAPLGVLDFDLAAAIWGVLLIASIFAALWILDVRDWRVVAVVVTSHPVITSVRLGTFTPVLLLLVAVAWRWRDRRWIVGSALAAALSLKLFLWPLLVWLVATRRFAAAAIAVGVAVVTTLAAWAVIGFEGLTSYPRLLGRLTDIVDTVGLSLVALGDLAGLPAGVAKALPFVVGFPLLIAVLVVAKRDDGNRRAFSIALVASLALTPILWLHYFSLLVAPLAIARPRFGWAWVLMWLFWLTPAQGNEGKLVSIVIAVALGAAVMIYSARPRPERVLV
jgi:hypothetical protein